jgi:MFS family permease
VRKATRVVASALGVFAGIGGPEHGIFEIIRGNVSPESVMIASMGPPCDPEQVWHACEPAMTVIPNFLVTGILATIVGAITMVWAGFFVQRKRSGLVLMLLSVALLLVGGGLMPPVIGIVAGVIGTRINTPVKRQPTRVSRFLAALWPWTLVAFLGWMFAQFPFGYFFNDFMMSTGYFFPLLIVGLMILAIVSAFAYDRQHRQRT